MIHPAHAQSQPGLCSLLIISIVSNDSVSGQQGHDQTAQADQDLRCPHMPEDTFSHRAAKLTLTTLRAKSVDDKLMKMFLFFQQSLSCLLIYFKMA